jgi:hypothetical protein
MEEKQTLKVDPIELNVTLKVESESLCKCMHKNKEACTDCESWRDRTERAEAYAMTLESFCEGVMTSAVAALADLRRKHFGGSEPGWALDLLRVQNALDQALVMVRERGDVEKEVEGDE